MRGKLDENMPAEAVAVLDAAGWSCHTVHDEGFGGAEDARLSEACRTEGRVLFTLDLDFADIRSYPPSDHEGLVVLRPVTPSRDSVLRLLERALPVLTVEWVSHRLWILEPARVRWRGAKDSESQ